ncbi:MAG TPA: hypothetical protein VFO41_08485 [Alphaproteobacteria bacterium]|nr:hypothetical protein [Alphaproteobacteria bacterium]
MDAPSTAFGRLLALVFLGAALATPPVAAQQNEPTDPGEALDELGRILDELGRMIDSMPRYELPEVTEDGDIIIRRKDRREREEEREEDGPPPVDPESVIDL